jgi:splicing factor 3B subunit 3
VRSKQDHDFLSHLEMYMRQEAAPLAGRDHLAFR